MIGSETRQAALFIETLEDLADITGESRHLLLALERHESALLRVQAAVSAALDRARAAAHDAWAAAGQRTAATGRRLSEAVDQQRQTPGEGWAEARLQAAAREDRAAHAAESAAHHYWMGVQETALAVDRALTAALTARQQHAHTEHTEHTEEPATERTEDAEDAKEYVTVWPHGSEREGNILR